jgi:hypothetical protein
MTSSVWKNAQRFYVNTPPFDIRDLGIHRFGCPWGDSRTSSHRFLETNCTSTVAT